MLSPDYNQQPRRGVATQQQQQTITVGGGGGLDQGTSSSTQTSDRMTPDSDSDDDYDYDVAVPSAKPSSSQKPGTGTVLGLDGAGDGEMFELQERGGKRERAGGGGDYFSPGYSLRQEVEDGTAGRRGGDRGGYGSEDSDGEYAEDDEGDPKYIHQQRRRQRGRRRRGASLSTVASFQLYTPDEERAVVRKFDRKLVVFVALLYLLSFLDRSNIGNARIAGMDDDLQSVPPKKDSYEWALSAFYIAYIAFEWMSLLWRLIPAHIYVTVLVLSWGLTASIQAVAVNYPMLIFLRTLLGIGEAGFTGIPFYLSFFFKRHELAFRTAIFISAAPLATSFASSLAWLIIKLGSYSPVAPWRLLFLIEGFPSVLAAALAWNIIPDSPQTASYLTKREKKVACLRLHQEKPSSSTPSPSRGLNPRDVLAALTDPISWLTATILFLTNMAYSSLPVFLPTILTSMGHSPLASQALAAPPYLASFLIVLATAHASDRLRSRSPFLIIHALASCLGYAVLALSGPGYLALDPGSWVRYLAVYPAAVGFFNVVVLVIVWSLGNQRGESRQGGGFALLQVVGQCGPLLGTRLYPDGEGPYYVRGMAVCAGAMGGVAVLAGGLRVYLGWLNGRLEKEGEGGGEDGDGDGDEEAEGLVGGGGGGGGGRGIGRRRRGGGGGFRYML